MSLRTMALVACLVVIQVSLTGIAHANTLSISPASLTYDQVNAPVAFTVTFSIGTGSGIVNPAIFRDDGKAYPFSPYENEIGVKSVTATRYYNPPSPDSDPIIPHACGTYQYRVRFTMMGRMYYTSWATLTINYPQGRHYKLEAEYGTWGNTGVNQYNSTYASNGKAVGRLDAVGDWSQVTTPILTTPGEFDLSIGYASTSSCSWSIYVNGVKVANVSCPARPTWNDFSISPAPIRIFLTSGENIIKIRRDSGDIGTALDTDYFEIVEYIIKT